MLPTLLLVFLLLCVYLARITKKNPYNHLPGPKVHPLFGNMLQLRIASLLRDFENWAWKYGSMYCLQLFWKPFLVISDIQMCHEILKSRPDGFARGAGVAQVAADLNMHGVFSQEGEEWRHSRRWIASAFSRTQVREFKRGIWYHSKKLQAKLSDIAKNQKVLLAQQHSDITSSTKAKYPMRHWYNGNDLTDNILMEIKTTILSIICDVSFSWGENNFLSPEILEKSKVLISRFFERTMTLFPIWKIYKSKDDRIAEEFTEEFNERIQTLVDQSNQSLGTDTGSSRTLLEILMKNTLEVDEEADLTETSRKTLRLTTSQMKANLLTVVLAGYESSATLMSWALYELAKNPSYQERIRGEAKQAFGDINKVDMDQDLDIIDKVLNSISESLPFINAFIQEIMRLHSVTPILHFSAIKDQEIQGIPIKQGTQIFLLTRLATLRSWPTSEPFKFNPGQWLGENGETESQIKVMNQTGLTFGYGPRVCPGRHLAEMELIVLLAMITTNFQLSLIDAPPAEEPVMEKFKFAIHPANIHIRIEQIEPI
ncbi:hypothetical protein K7432_014985 [Basidiobolus ranarum]|uniref:Cytochrome P450 n=1 Tax=Basidiobolus ranarum TaxID=34480 RepID=A0ABR2WGW6_9FUNG